VTTAMFRVLCVVGLLAGLASPVRADLIVADPNAHTLGTNLSAMFPGLSLTRLTNQPNQDGPDGRTAFRPVASPVYATGTYHDPTTLSLGGTMFHLENYDICSRAGSTFASLCAYQVLELTFDTPTSFFQLDSIGFSDGAAIIVFDIFGNRLSGFQTVHSLRNTGGSATTFTMTRSTADIGRIVYGGNVGTTTATRLTYNVPEPLTLGFVSLGLVGAGIFARRRKSSR
jgi:hypothetical protein